MSSFFGILRGENHAEKRDVSCDWAQVGTGSVMGDALPGPHGPGSRPAD